jgi:UDP-N-acetylmuramoylalanine--D-glutamate ligase
VISHWRNLRVTVMGLGRFGGGVGVTRWLAARGARVLVTDQAPAEQLEGSLAAIADCGVQLRLGGHDESDFRSADLVVVNPAVCQESEWVELARRVGVPITTEINLFVERCPARTVGITGSVGKSTVTAMVGHVLEKARPAGSRSGRVWVGGNLGTSLLGELDRMTPRDLVVLELSSFQLERTPLVGWSPSVAVITNISPNHLDWHGSFAAYTAAKLNIVRYQQPGRDHLVIHDAEDLRGTLERLLGDLSGVWRYGLDGDVPRVVAQQFAAVECDDVRERWGDVRLAVPGRHNRENAAAALAVAHVLGAPASAAVEAIAGFPGLPHRLQRVGERAGVAYYDDSKSTTPAAALMAMRSFDGPLLVILGGHDKGSDLSDVARFAAGRARYAACIGTTGPAIAACIHAAGGQAELHDNLAAAVSACRKRALPGDTVLLSPACASWGMFTDYRERGAAFARLVTHA